MAGMDEAPRTLMPASYFRIDQLAPGMRGVNLVARVVSREMKVDRLQINGHRIRTGEVLLGDESGTAVLTTRNGV